MEIAIVICNYNKKDYVIQCIQSVLASDLEQYYLVVVDNASTDGSPQAIRQNFEGRLHLIENEENAGGSGGFNKGLRYAQQLGVKYIVLLDNDVVLEPDAIRKLYEFMEENPSVGMAGSKICMMDQPELLQEYGADIDFENYTIKPYFKSHLDNEKIPPIHYCTYLPACSLMVKTEALLKTGLMPENNFIYWDDIEWGYLFRKNRYDVAVCGASRVRHKMGAQSRSNTFATYYFYRNRIRFFARYVDEKQIDDFCAKMLKEIFRATYACLYNQKLNSMTTIFRAFDDALNGLTGKAQEGRILEADQPKDRFGSFTFYNNILLYANEDIRITRNVLNQLKQVVHKDCKMSVCSNGAIENSLLEEQFPQYFTGTFTEEGFDCIVEVCRHIFDCKQIKENRVYIDEYFNLIQTEEDRKLCENADSNFLYFYHLHFSAMKDKVQKLRSTV